MNKRIIRLLTAVIVIIVAFTAYGIIFIGKTIKVLDKDTNSPVQGVKVSLFTGDPIFTGVSKTKKLSDTNGKISSLSPFKHYKAVFHKEGYYPYRCYFGKSPFDECSDTIYLKPIKNLVNLVNENISYWDQIVDKSNGKEISKDFSLWGNNSYDFNISFIKDDSPNMISEKNGVRTVLPNFYTPKSITFYGQGGIQLAAKNEQYGLLNITEAPSDGYSKTISEDFQFKSYIFKTADGKHFGKFYFNTAGDRLNVFVNPNENDRNLEYKLPLKCLRDVLDNSVDFIELDPAFCNN